MEGGREAKKRKKPQNSCRRPGETSVERGKNVEKKAANPDNLESNKEAGGEHKVLRAQV